MRALWDNIRFNKPKNKYSLEHLKYVFPLSCVILYVDYCFRYLYSIISKNPIINEQNKVIIIETLRQIAELLIWGDQHNSMFFEYVHLYYSSLHTPYVSSSYFLEKNLLAYFLNILDQKTSKNVKVQLLQTLSILIENIRAQNSLCMLIFLVLSTSFASLLPSPLLSASSHHTPNLYINTLFYLLPHHFLPFHSSYYTSYAIPVTSVIPRTIALAT